MESMDHSMHMSMSSPTTASVAMASGTGSMMMAMPSSTGAADGMNMDMGAGGHDMGSMMGGCKIDMLWNWFTIDACFISRSWKISSKGMFAGSCIGVILLVMVLELLRRAGKEYDRYLVAQHLARVSTSSSATAGPTANSSTANINNGNENENENGSTNKGRTTAEVYGANVRSRHGEGLFFRPNIWQQGIRALLHMAQFAVAYFVMLLAMYYNGYIIICIFLGAFLGYFVFGWEGLKVGEGRREEEVTVCCG